jgi:hypothetical protein
VGKQCHPIRNARRLVEIVQRNQHGFTLFAGHFCDQQQDLDLVPQIQVSYGFVKQQNGRALCQGAGDEHSLLLPSR